MSLHCHQMNGLDKCFKFLVQGSLMKQLINTLTCLVDMAGQSGAYPESCNIQRNVLQEAILCSYELLITIITHAAVSFSVKFRLHFCGVLFRFCWRNFFCQCVCWFRQGRIIKKHLPHNCDLLGHRLMHRHNSWLVSGTLMVSHTGSQ